MGSKVALIAGPVMLMGAVMAAAEVAPAMVELVQAGVVVPKALDVGATVAAPVTHVAALLSGEVAAPDVASGGEPVGAMAAVVVSTSQPFLMPTIGSDPKNSTEHSPVPLTLRSTHAAFDPNRTRVAVDTLND